MLAGVQRDIQAATGILVPASRIVEAALRAWKDMNAWRPIDERRPGQVGVPGGDDVGVDPVCR